MSMTQQAILIGAGMVAQTHVDAIAASQDRVKLSGVVARSSAKAFATRNKLTAHETLETALEAKPDFAILATPPNARLELVRKLVAARVPILTEKPLERTLTAARKVVSLCEEADLPLGVIFQHRTRAAVAELRKQLPALGEIASVEISVRWWRDQSYYDAPGRGTYAQDGGGVLITQAIHTLDLVLSLVGPVARVQAMARRTALHDMEGEDFVAAGLDFAQGTVGVLHATTAAFPGEAERITLHGAHGVADLVGDDLRIAWRNGKITEAGQSAATGAGADPMGFTSDWHQAVIEDFAEALQDDRPPLVTGREGLKVHALIDALIRSSEQQRQVEVADV